MSHARYSFVELFDFLSRKLKDLTTQDILYISNRCQCNVDDATIQKHSISGALIASHSCEEFISKLDPQAADIIPLTNLYAAVAYIYANRAFPDVVLLGHWLTANGFTDEAPKFIELKITESMVPHMKGE